jgi:hypothetical protein
MTFAGTFSLVCYVEIKSVGSISDAQTESMSSDFCQEIEAYLRNTEKSHLNAQRSSRPESFLLCFKDEFRPSKRSAKTRGKRINCGSSLPFMLNQQTRCQDNILLTQKFRKFLKP